MTTITHAPASPPPALNLDARLVLASLAMDDRLGKAAAAFEVNTAHIATAAPPEIDTTLPLTPTLAPSPHDTPIAGLLQRARQRIETDGWCRDNLFDDQGAVCPIRAIRLEATNRRQADDACILLLESIQRTIAAETIPSWNAAQTSPVPVLLAFTQAAELAADRGL
jgi:hypothetical protein